VVGFGAWRLRDTLKGDMLPRASVLCGFLSVCLAQPLCSQVVFSRRVYQERGRTYQEIWNWNPADNSIKQLSDSPRDHFRPTCSGGRILFVSPEDWQDSAKLWSFDRTSKEEKIAGRVPERSDRKSPIKGCAVSATSGTAKACANGAEVVITRNQKQAAPVRIGHDMPIEWMEWSPDDQWLLVATLGWETNSTSPQLDFYLVQAGPMAIVKVGSGNDGMWVPGRNEVLYTTPRDMGSLPGGRRERGVWVAHLKVFNPASQKTVAITSGLTNNIDPSACRQ
jgi:hypothetical protein